MVLNGKKYAKIQWRLYEKLWWRLEEDTEYPKNLHDSHNDLPFLQKK